MGTEPGEYIIERGITVIELVVAVLIVGLLTVAGVGAYQRVTSNSRDAATEANLHTVAAAIVAEHHSQEGVPLFTRSAVLAAVAPIEKEIIDGGISASSDTWVFHGSGYSPQHFGEFAVGFDTGPGTPISDWAGSRVTILTSSGSALFGRTIADDGSQKDLGELGTGLTIPDVLADPETSIPDAPEDDEHAATRGELTLTYSTEAESCTANTVLLPVWGPFAPGSTVDWGDGQVEPLANLITHTYKKPGSYTVSVTGTFTRFGTETSHPYRGCLIHVNQWEKTGVTSTSGAFRDEFALRGTVAPPTTVTDMSYMFEGITLWEPLRNWDVGNVKNFVGMFQNTGVFNSPIGDWDTSSATDMSYMFAGTDTFSQNLSNWDTSNVTQMVGMFADTYSFNGELNGWDTSQVTDMSDMFANSRSFNKDIDRWDISSLKSAARMFKGAQSFNGQISAWDVSGITDMGEMFYNAVSFERDLSSWDVAHAKTDDMLTGSQTGRPYNRNKQPPALR